MFVPQTYDVPLWKYIAFCTHPSNEFVTKVTNNPASQSPRMPSEIRIEQIGTLYLSITLRIGLKTQTLSLGLEFQSTIDISQQRHAQLYSFTAIPPLRGYIRNEPVTIESLVLPIPMCCSDVTL